MNTVTEAESLDRTPTEHVVLPVPIVDWTAVVKAENPGKEPTRGRLRELRKKGHLTDGITVTRRGDRGLQGRANYYSVLSALAARSRQEGNDEDAAELERSASELETRFREKLQQFLSAHDLEDLPEADFCEELAAATAKRLAGWRRLHQALLAAAVVIGTDGNTAHLHGTSPRGEPVEVDLPQLLLDRQSLTAGDTVWVLSRVVGDAALVELLPAIRVQLRDWKREHVPTELSGLVDTIWTKEPPAAGDDGLAEADRAAQAEHYRSTAAANLTMDQIAQLKAAAAAGHIPRRRLRPAG
jgi:hypothetical protein